MRAVAKVTVCLALFATAVGPADTRAQSLARQVAQHADGTVRVTYPARPDVEICDQGIHMGEHRVTWRSRGWDDEPTNCRTGSVEIEVRVRDGSVRGVEVVRRLRDRTEGADDLGSFSAQEAADFLLDAAHTGGSSGRGEEDAIFAALLADVTELWRDLLQMAQNPALEKDVRTTSLFWVGQEAASVVTEGLARVAMDEEEDQDVREAAVFALSQRPSDEGVPILMEVARTAKEAETRESAIFWLAQSDDERVYAFFEEILVGGGG